MKNRIALLLVLISGSSLPGTGFGGDATLKPAFLVIAAGSKEKTKAEAAFKDYQTRGLPTHGDFPKLMESSKIKGLNPGFWIVVAAAPTQQPVAQAISLFLQRSLKDAYIKPVEIPEPESLSVLATDDRLHFLPETQLTDLTLAGWFKREHDCTFALFDPRKPEAKRILAVTPDCPKSYTLSFSPDHKKVILNLKGEEPLELGLATLTQTRIPDPELSEGTIEATGFGKDGNIYLLQSEDVEVIRDEEKKTAHFLLDGKQVPLDFDLTADGSIATTLCTVYRREKTTWMQHVRGPLSFRFEGREGPFCDSFDKAPKLVPFLDPDNSSFGGLESSEVPKEQEKPILETLAPKNDGGYWGILTVGVAKIAARITWLEGEFKHTPALFWKKGKDATDGNWIPLKGLENSGFLAGSELKAHFLACTDDFAGVYDQESGALIWSTQGACPAKWPDDAR